VVSDVGSMVVGLMVNESPQTSRLARGLRHETNPPRIRAGHPTAQLGICFQGAIDLIDPRQALLDRRHVYRRSIQLLRPKTSAAAPRSAAPPHRLTPCRRDGDQIPGCGRSTSPQINEPSGGSCGPVFFSAKHCSCQIACGIESHAKVSSRTASSAPRRTPQYCMARRPAPLPASKDRALQRKPNGSARGRVAAAADRRQAALANHWRGRLFTPRPIGVTHRSTVSLPVNSAGLHPSWEQLTSMCCAYLPAAGDHACSGRHGVDRWASGAGSGCAAEGLACPERGPGPRLRGAL
jgi:hypothetical protein